MPRNRTVIWTLGLASIPVGIWGVVLILDERLLDGLLTLGVVMVWMVGATSHYVVVTESTVRHRAFFQSFTVDLNDVTKLAIEEDGFYPVTRLVLTLASGGTRRIHPGMFSIGPIRFLRATAQAISKQMQHLDLSVELPSELM